jgi:DNA repair protein RAD57
MTDLSIILPGFATQDYVHLIPSLEKSRVTTTDLITLDAVDIAKRAHLPILDIKRLCNAVLQELQCDLGVGRAIDIRKESEYSPSVLRKTGEQVIEPWSTISTLDDAVDKVLGGGIPTGYMTEITGERLVLF